MRYGALYVHWKPGWGASYDLPDYEVQWRDMSLPDRPENWSSDIKRSQQRNIWVGGLTNGRTYVVRLRAFKGSKVSDWVVRSGVPSAQPTPTPTINEYATCFGDSAAWIRDYSAYRPKNSYKASDGDVEIEQTFLNPRSDSGETTWRFGLKIREWNDGRYALHFIVINDRTWTFELQGDTNQVLDSGTLPESVYDNRVSDPVSVEGWYAPGYCYVPSQYRNTLKAVSKGTYAQFSKAPYSKDTYEFQFFVNDFEVALNIDDEDLDLMEETVFKQLDQIGGRIFENPNDLWQIRAVKECNYHKCFLLQPGKNTRFGGLFQPEDHRRGR